MLSIRPAASFLALVVAATPAAHAQDMPAGDGKAITGEVNFEFHSDWATHSSNPANKRNSTYAKIEAVTEARLAPELFLKSQVTFDRVTEAEPGKDQFFNDQGAFLEKFFLEYTKGDFGLRGGKFGQKFGITWDVAPGIWAKDFARDYELSEQDGVAVDYNFGAGGAGKHVVTVGSFFQDTSVLSESVITNRHRTRKSDGGAGNTEDFSNYALALEGGAFTALPGLSYHLAYTSRASNAAGETRETGVAAAVQMKFTVGAVEINPLIEYVTFEDRSGVVGTDSDYLTTAAEFVHGKWNLALSRTARSTKAAGSARVDDSLVQATVGYAFDSGINVNAGYRIAEESGITTDTIGGLVQYTLKF